MSRNKTEPMRVSFEHLEERYLMAARLTASLAGGALTITGSDAADVIVMQQAGTRLSVDGLTQGFRADRINKLVIDGGPGNDQIRLGSSVQIPAELKGGDGDDFITGGRAADKLYGGPGNDSLDGGAGVDQLFGEAGDDMLTGLVADEYLDGGAGSDSINGVGEVQAPQEVFQIVAGQTTTLGDGGIDFEGYYFIVTSNPGVPTNMDNAGVNDRCAYNFPLGYRVLPNQPAGVVPITIILRQGADERRFAVDLVVTNPGLTAPVPTAPIGTTASTNPTFTFSPVTGAARYEIWVEDLNDGNRRVLYAPAVTGSSWTAPMSLIRGRTYRWWVRAVGSDGKAGPWSNPQDFTIALVTAPVAPTSLTFNIVSASRIDLTWNDVSNETGYAVWLNSGNGWQKVVDLAANATGVSITNLIAGTAYTFAVVAFNSAGTTYAYVNARTAANTPPTSPGTLGSEIVSSTEANLFWSDSAGESGYIVEYWNGSSAIRFAQAGANATSLRVTNVFGYYIRVGAFNAQGVTYTNWLYVA